MQSTDSTPPTTAPPTVARKESKETSGVLRHSTREEIQDAHTQLTSSFNSGLTLNINYRKHQLKQLTYLLKENTDAIAEAVQRDLGRCKFESVFAEVMTTTNELIEAINNVKSWSKGSFVWNGVVWALHRPQVKKDPKGTVLVIGAWNYPVAVQIGPIVGALAAGCTVVLKPSELSAHSAQLFAELWPKYMDPRTCRIVNGAIDETTQLLDLRWDHIFYTGNGVVGKIIATKAAQHLTPTTLELGGKSPVIIDDSADARIAARRIIWGKAVNVGQTCIAPDYVICTSRKQQDKLVKEMQAALKEFYPNGTRQSADYGRIINDRHFERVTGLLNQTKGTIVCGGETDASQRFVDLTVVTDVQKDDALMQQELFAPILPVVLVESVDKAIEYVNVNDRPLVLYIFASGANKRQIVKRTRSGGVVSGDLLIHYVFEKLPFGGTGASGYGSYHGKSGFDAFSHERCYVQAPDAGLIGKVTELVLSQRYPPYSPSKLQIMRLALAKTPRFSRPEKQFKA